MPLALRTSFARSAAFVSGGVSTSGGGGGVVVGKCSFSRSSPGARGSPLPGQRLRSAPSSSQRHRAARRFFVTMAGGNKQYKYIILGGGNAGGYAAARLVEQHALAPHSLAIVSADAYAPYERPALSKGFLTANPPARLPGFHTCVGGGGERHGPEWYEQNGIDLYLSTRVASADVKAKELKTADGDSYKYDKLMVATGSGVVKLSDFGAPGAHLKGIHYLREMADAFELYDAMKANDGCNAVVIGGGYIGMECAAALAVNNVNVTMVFPEEHLMPRLFTPEIAQHYEKAYGDKGVRFVKGTLAESLQGDDSGAVKEVKLKNGTTLPADMVVVGVGARPNVELFKDSLQMEAGGIQVDGYMRTSDASVYAVGDVAAFPLRMYGDRMTRVEHVDHSRKSATHAADAMAADGEASGLQPYTYLPFFYSRVFSLSWKFWGDTPPGADVVLAGKMDPKLLALWISQDSLVLGAFIEGGTEEEEGKVRSAAQYRRTVNADAVKKAAASSDGIDAVLEML